MLQKLRSLSIASKLALLALLSILLVLSCLTIYAVAESKNTLMTVEVDNLKLENKLVIDMIDAYDQSLQRPTVTLLSVFRSLFPETFTLSQKVTQVGAEMLPVLLADSDEINNQTFQVDRFHTLTSAVATVFVKRGSDFYRATTSVLDANKQRVLGTALSKTNPAYAALARGESYIGLVKLFGKSYMAGYEPIRNPEKEIIGAFFVGVDFGAEMAALKKKIKQLKIGETGFFVIVDAAKGERYGEILIHPTLEGKSGLDLRDADGKFLIKESLEAKSGTRNYNWLDEDESVPGEKIAAFATYDNWHWLVFGGSYVDEFGRGAQALSRNLILASLLSGLLLAATFYYFLRRQIGEPLAHAAAIAESVATGNLTQKIEIHRDDETGKLLASLQTMSDSLARVARTVHERSTLIQEGVRQINMGNLDLSQRSEEQASTLEETAAGVESVSAAARDNAAIAAQGRKLATEAAHAAAENATSMTRLSEAINSMHGSSKQISEFVGVIDGLAFQTNILALNAAVEAARAGEQGRGFAVVASEVRNLAQRSSESAKDIRAIISQSSSTMEMSAKLAQDVAKSSQITQSTIETVTELMTQIADGSREQSASIEQINQAMGQLDNVTQQNAALVEEASAAAQSLEEQSYHLLEAVKLLRFERTESSSAFIASALPHELRSDSGRTIKSLPARKDSKKLLRRTHS